MRTQFTPTPDQWQQFVDDVLPTVIRYANQAWRPLFGDRDDWIADVRALAVQGWLSCLASGNDRWTPGTIAWHAIVHRRAGRTLQACYGRSVQSVVARGKGVIVRSNIPEHTPKSNSPGRDNRELYSWDQFADPRANPAEVVAFRLDVPAWLRSLPRRLRLLAKLLMAGAPKPPVGPIARKLGVTPGRISQLRRALRDDWHGFTADPRDETS